MTAREVATLSAAIKPLLAGKPPEVQSGALADLLSIWLAGHIVQHDRPATDRLRKQLLDLHIDLVRKLVSESEKEIFGRDRN